MRTVEYRLGGHTFTLLLNAAALTEIYERFGPDVELGQLLGRTDKEGFQTLSWLLSVLSMQGELLRRWSGQDRRPIMPEGFFRVHLSPGDMIDGWQAVGRAYALAFRRDTAEDEEDEEIDLVLAEIQKKTKI